MLVAGIAALVADGFDRPASTGAMVALAIPALMLDAVDGRVARRTGTASPLGARFDMETDAFLILALSVQAARAVGLWVLAIGFARYAFVIAGWLLPWLRAAAPSRYWRKVVAAIQGIALTAAVSGALPRWLTAASLAAALALLAESFGRDIWWLWRNPRAGRTGAQRAADRARGRANVRRGAGWVVTAVAFVLVWFALVAPTQLSRLSLDAFLRIPVEGLILVALCLVLPGRARQVFAGAVGVLLGLLALTKVLDMGSYEVLDRPFNPVTDRAEFGPALGVVRDSVGSFWAGAAQAAAVLIVLALLVLVPLSAMRLARLASRHRTASGRALGALGVAWLVSAVLGVQIGAGAPIASGSASALAYDQVQRISSSIADERTFAAAISASDPVRDVPGTDLLTGLRGKDVIVAFVESYGRVAVQDSSFSPQVDAVLNSGTAALDAAGLGSRSAFLTSPTFGGISWLAHSTLQSGLWVDSQQRYDQLVASDRFTLSDAFKKAGWRTVGDVPSNTEDWPQGTDFYHYDKIYDSRNVGYEGPKFSYAQMPDQYILSAFQKMELAKTNRAPVMAEIDLVSSHTPWTPLPTMVDWSKLGDGSIYDGMPQQGPSRSQVWPDPAKVQAAYGQSVQYSMSALISFVQTFHDDNLVLVVLGDHQPATIVSGSGASRDVPISIIAHDPAVLDSIASWGWQDGLLPNPQAPVWPMDSFRNRFLTAYGPP